MDDVTIGNGVEGLSKHAFSAKFIFYQAVRPTRAAVRPACVVVRPATSGGPIGQASGVMAGGQTGHGRRSDRHLSGFPERVSVFP